jgi:hypothetical protein
LLSWVGEGRGRPEFGPNTLIEYFCSSSSHTLITHHSSLITSHHSLTPSLTRFCSPAPHNHCNPLQRLFFMRLNHYLLQE